MILAISCRHRHRSRPRRTRWWGFDPRGAGARLRVAPERARRHHRITRRGRHHRTRRRAGAPSPRQRALGPGPAVRRSRGPGYLGRWPGLPAHQPTTAAGVVRGAARRRGRADVAQVDAAAHPAGHRSPADRVDAAAHPQAAAHGVGRGTACRVLRGRRRFRRRARSRARPRHADDRRGGHVVARHRGELGDGPGEPARLGGAPSTGAWCCRSPSPPPLASLVGGHVASRLPYRILTRAFAGILALVAAYMLVRSLG